MVELYKLCYIIKYKKTRIFGFFISNTFINYFFVFLAGAFLALASGFFVAVFLQGILLFFVENKSKIFCEIKYEKYFILQEEKQKKSLRISSDFLYF